VDTNLGLYLEKKEHKLIAIDVSYNVYLKFLFFRKHLNKEGVLQLAKNIGEML